MAPRIGLVGRLLLVALGYYVGARLGFVLKFPHETPSVMWPPNAVLTTALLLATPRRWWMYLLAALPAHLAVELPAIGPPAVVFGLFLTNCSEAVLGAGLLRRFSDQPARFNTLPRMALFIAVVGIAAPFLSTFPDATLVTFLRGESYWNVWMTRFPSNVLGALTITPTLVMLLTAEYSRLRTIPLRRVGEALVVISGLLAPAIFGFVHTASGAEERLWSPQTPLALIMPFLLWAAVRFGPRCLSVCLLITTALAIRAGILEGGAFTMPHRESTVLALQILLIVVSIPLLCMASVMEERRRTSEALGERLAFEEMLARLSNAFVHLPSSEMDRAFETWLQKVAQHLRLDCLALLEFAATGEEFVVRSWTRGRPSPGPLGFASDDFPWVVAQLRAEQTLKFRHPDDLPMVATSERAILRRHGVRTGTVLPLEAGGRILGGLAFVRFSDAPERHADVESRLGLVGEVFANALAR